jgi:carboxylesterase type B
VANETAFFVPQWVVTETDFDNYLNMFTPEPQLEGVRQAIKIQYPAQGPPYNGNQHDRLADIIRDSSFTCNTRWLYDAYTSIGAGTYMLQYDFLNNFLGKHYNLAVHASDLLPLFWNSDVNMTFYLEHCANISTDIAGKVAKFWDEYAQGYQKYFVRHAITGHPAKSGPFHIPWFNATMNGDQNLADVMKTSTGLTTPNTYFNPLSTDVINGEGSCGFWKSIAAKIDEVGRGNDEGEGEQELLVWNEEL